MMEEPGATEALTATTSSPSMETKEEDVIPPLTNALASMDSLEKTAKSLALLSEVMKYFTWKIDSL